MVNEMLLGEQVHTTKDLSWRVLEVLVWGGFFLGVTGYLRMYIVAIERECWDNRDQIGNFKRAVLEMYVGICI